MGVFKTMSSTAEVLIKYEGTLETLKVAIERVFGELFSVYERVSDVRGEFHGKLLTYDVMLSNNFLDNDLGIKFEDFQFVLILRVAGHLCAVRLREQLVPITDLIGELVSRHLNVETIVTIKVQELKARYPPRKCDNYVGS